MTSRPITKEEHIMIMKTMNENHEGFFRRNPQIIHILTVECSTGLRLGDILRMKLSDIYRTDKGYAFLLFVCVYNHFVYDVILYDYIIISVETIIVAILTIIAILPQAKTNPRAHRSGVCSILLTLTI